MPLSGIGAGRSRVGGSRPAVTRPRIAGLETPRVVWAVGYFGCWMRRVENQDVKAETWNSCTRPANGRRNSTKPRPLISTTY